MSTETSLRAATVDMAAIIDGNPMSGLQWRIVALCMLAALLDGADSFSIGAAAPAIAAKLALKPAEMGAVFSAATFGAAAGALSFGPLADRFGRKLMLVLAMAVFAVFTYFTAMADTKQSLIAVRFCAGIGLGGATPCFLSLAGEYVPSRLRASVTTLLWAGFPFGGMLGGFLNAFLLKNYDWTTLFYVGGVLPLLVTLIIATLVPEAPSVLVHRGHGGASLARLAARIAPELAGTITAATQFVRREAALAGVPVRRLFTEGRAAVTLLLWVPFFLGFGILLLVVLWTPTLARNAGMSAPDAALVVAYHGLGGAIGMASSGKLIEKFGPKILVPALIAGAVCTLIFGSVTGSFVLASLLDGLIGVFVGIGAAGAIALAALIYPTAIRSSGIGWAMAMGRFGQVVAPLVVGLMLAGGWKPDQMFTALAAAPLVAAAVIPLVARGMKQQAG